jgi:hypothetical protein
VKLKHIFSVQSIGCVCDELRPSFVQPRDIRLLFRDTNVPFYVCCETRFFSPDAMQFIKEDSTMMLAMPT